MPKPVYILCSESGSEDKATSLVSHFNVIEQIELRETRAPSESQTTRVFLPFALQVTSVWARAEADEPDQEFEFVISLFLPPDGNEVSLATGRWSFDKLRFRLTCHIGALQLKGSGQLRAESKMRVLGGSGDSWVKQTYEIPVIYITSEDSHQPESHTGESAKVNETPE